MKPGKVYIKIFLSFLAVLMVTEVVIFVLFMVYAGRPAKAWTERLNAAKLALVKDTIEGIIQEKIRSEPGADLSKSEPLNRFIQPFRGALRRQGVAGFARRENPDPVLRWGCAGGRRREVRTRTFVECR